jgi:hypothetical protein
LTFCWGSRWRLAVGGLRSKQQRRQRRRRFRNGSRWGVGLGWGWVVVRGHHGIANCIFVRVDSGAKGVVFRAQIEYREGGMGGRARSEKREARHDRQEHDRGSGRMGTRCRSVGNVELEGEVGGSRGRDGGRGKGKGRERERDTVIVTFMSRPGLDLSGNVNPTEKGGMD